MLLRLWMLSVVICRLRRTCGTASQESNSRTSKFQVHQSIFMECTSTWHSRLLTFIRVTGLEMDLKLDHIVSSGVAVNSDLSIRCQLGKCDFIYLKDIIWQVYAWKVKICPRGTRYMVKKTTLQTGHMAYTTIYLRSQAWSWGIPTITSSVFTKDPSQEGAIQMSLLI